MDTTDDELRRYRRDRFAAKMESARRGEPGELALRVTTNGDQWQSLALTVAEQRRVLLLLLEAEQRREPHEMNVVEYLGQCLG